MKLSIIISCLAAGVMASTTERKMKYNPETQLFYIKGKNIPEDGFFDPSSKDLENAFTSLVINTHPLYKHPDIPYLVSSTALSFESELVDLELFENCMSINSHWDSMGLTDDEIEPLLKAFWEGIGVFNYIKYDETTQRWIEVVMEESESEDEVAEVAVEEVKTKKNKKVKKNKKKNGNNSGKAKASQPKVEKTCALMNPKMDILRLTLENPACQRTLAIALTVLNTKQTALLFRNIPAAILDNPEIIRGVGDYSEFKDKKSVETLASIMADQNQRITEDMAKSLPIKALHRVIEAKNFDLSSEELKILIANRIGFEFHEPFVSDHRTFRIFCADQPFFPLPPADLILKSIGGDKMGADVIESVLAYYIRGEYGVQMILSMIAENMADGEIVSKAVMDLTNVFSERNQISNRLNESFPELANFIRIPLVPAVRAIFNGESVLKSTWDYLFVNATDDEKLVTLRTTMPYIDYLAIKNSYEVYELWNEIVFDASGQFRQGRWARNLLQILFSVANYTENSGTKQSSGDNSLIMRAKGILSRHLGPQKFIDFSFGPFDWFLNRIKDIMCLERGSTALERVSWGYKISRELTKILAYVDFFADGVIEAIWTNESAMTAIVSFPFCLNHDHVDALRQTSIGKELLKENPYLLQRLPSYGTFTVEDMEEFNMTLDDLVINIGTLNVEVAREWLKRQEYLVNSSVRVLYRPHVTVHSELGSWSFVGFEALRTAPDMAKDLRITEGLALSQHLDLEATLEGKLSLVARWLVHLEIQTAWMWLLCRLPYFNTESMNITTETVVFTTFELVEVPKVIAKLKKEFKATSDAVMKKQVHELMLILKGRPISSFKAQVQIPANERDAAYPQVKADNEFICSLIRGGPGSEKFKRVWIHRAKLLTYPSVDIKTLHPFDSMAAAEQGMVPLDDALLQWFITNRMTIEKLRVKAGIRVQNNLPVERVKEDEHPEYEWLNLIIPS